MKFFAINNFFENLMSFEWVRAVFITILVLLIIIFFINIILKIIKKNDLKLDTKIKKIKKKNIAIEPKKSNFNIIRKIARPTKRKKDSF